MISVGFQSGKLLLTKVSSAVTSMFSSLVSTISLWAWRNILEFIVLTNRPPTTAMYFTHLGAKTSFLLL